MKGKVGYINSARLRPNVMGKKTVTALADADATLTAAELLGGLFTITPSAARTLTTDTAANIVAAIPGAQVGTSFEFTAQCLAAFAVTLAGGTNVTLSGNVAPNNISASFLAVLTDVTSGAEAVTIYRTDGGAT